MVTFCAVNCLAMVTVQNLEYKTFGIQFYIIGCIRLGSECSLISICLASVTCTFLFKYDKN